MVRSMQRSEREVPVRCFFWWLKARRLADEEGDSFWRSDSSAENCLRDYFFPFQAGFGKTVILFILSFPVFQEA